MSTRVYIIVLHTSVELYKSLANNIRKFQIPCAYDLKFQSKNSNSDFSIKKLELDFLTQGSDYMTMEMFFGSYGLFTIRS